MTHESVTIDDQWNAWQAALTGTPIPTERGNPRSGYFKRNTDKPSPQDVEIICIYRDEANKLQCLRTVYGDGSKMDEAAIDDLFGQVCMYPVPYVAWEMAQAGETWPAAYRTRLSLEESRQGVVWTIELGEKKAAPDALLAENARAVAGHNSGDREPHQLLRDRVEALEEKRVAWLRSIGGSVTTQEQADKAADFKVAMQALEKEAEDQHRERKKPHWDAGKAVDNAWIPVRDLAKIGRERAAKMAEPFLKAQAEANRRAAAEAQRIERERVEAERRAASSQSQPNDRIPAPQQPAAASPTFEPAKAKAGTGRGVTLKQETVCLITNVGAVATFFASKIEPPAELLEVLRKLANTALRRGDEVPGAKLDTREVAR